MSNQLIQSIQSLKSEKDCLITEIEAIQSDYIENNIEMEEPFFKSIEDIYHFKDEFLTAADFIEDCYEFCEEQTNNIHMTRKNTELKKELNNLFLEIQMLIYNKNELLDTFEYKINYQSDDDENYFDYDNEPKELDPEIEEAANILTNFNRQEEEEKRQQEINEKGYCKKECVKTMTEYIKLIPVMRLREQKMIITKNLFNYMSTPSVKKFIYDYDRFSLTVKKKLIELRDTENMKQTRVWWRNIYNERMPVSLE